MKEVSLLGLDVLILFVWCKGIDGTGDGVWKLLNIMRVIGIIHIGIDHRRSWTF